MRPILLCLLLCCALTACGSKGNLYIPEQQYPQSSK
jgi:predicted small lipoprotein YifL